MFEDLPRYQLRQLETVWTTAAKAVHWRESLRYKISRAIAAGCTLEHLAAVTGFDQETIERLRREPQRDFNGRHPTDPTRPDRSSSTGDTDRCSYGLSRCCGGAGRPVMGHSS
jgi:hypothetical protein